MNNVLKQRIKVAIATSILTLGIDGTIMHFRNKNDDLNLKELNYVYHLLCEESEIILKDEISLYNEYLKEYANYINSLGLDDLQIIIKVMSDCRKISKENGKPGEIYDGYYRLNLYMGDACNCKNYADDFTAKMNAINPLYKATNIIVYLNNNVLINESNKNSLNDKKANHIVSLICIPETDIKLIVDPMNLLIGTFDEGKIRILNGVFDEYAALNLMTLCYDDNIIFSNYDYKKAVKYVDKLLADDLITDLDLDEVYGFEAQNKAYNELLKLLENSKIVEPTPPVLLKK